MDFTMPGSARRTAKTKKLGQNFLMSRDIAKAEAVHAEGKTVLEIGPGYGILTEEMCKAAKGVVAVEKDKYLCRVLSGKPGLHNLKLINADFLDVSDEEIGIGNIDILISNVPYNISSKVIGWIAEKRIQAVLCLQKEFVEHMLAKEDSESYSKLSVVSALSFSITEIMNVGRRNFRPIPRVDSEIIYIKPKENAPGENERNTIGALMQHKKKTVRNAVMDSREGLGIGKDDARKLAAEIEERDERVFKLSPERLLDLSERILSFKRRMKAHEPRRV